MKKLLFLMLVVPLIGWFGISDGHCEEEIIYACYKKESGQMRLVSNVNECLSSELSVYWSKDGYVPVYFKDLYVNISTGVDEEGYGLSDDSPFETISYAIEQVPYLRKSPDFKTTIHIAGRNYQENINLDIDNVEFIAEPKGGVLITAPANDQSAFEVTTASGIILDGIVITGGYRGFFCKSNSSCKLINCEIKNAAWRGIQVDENSGIFIKDCTTDSCGRDGLGIFLSSNATITGDSNEFNNNMRNGVTVGLSSSLIMDSAKVTTIGNQRDGIQATGGSEVTTVDSNILTEVI